MKNFVDETIVLNKPRIDLYFSYKVVKLDLSNTADYFLIRKSFSGIILFIILFKFKLIGEKIPPIIWEVNNFSNLNN